MITIHNYVEIEIKETWDSRSCGGPWEMFSATVSRGGHCATLNILATPRLLLHRTPQEGRVGTGAGGNRPPPPLLLGPNFSVSHILIWNNYLSCIVMESCILFPVVPAKGTWY